MTTSSSKSCTQKFSKAITPSPWSTSEIHSSKKSLGNLSSVVSKISSVGELLYSIFTNLDWEISPQIATCLFSAISFDTGRFAYSNVTDQTLLAASKLKQLGAKPYEIYQALDENKTENDFQLIKIAIDNLVIIKEYSLAYTTIPKNSPRGSIKVIDFIRQLKNIELCIVFQELRSNLVKVNLRSKHKTNVTKIAAYFGGGGHNRAAGIVFEKELNECKLELIDYIKETKT